jgi:hypothetical protein
MTGTMRIYRVNVEERFWRGTDPGRDHRGHCYEMALKYLAAQGDEPALRLVHGTLQIVSNPYAHAWVEFLDTWVFDPVDQDFYDRRAYYRELQAAAERVYTATEAGELALTTGHYGPWHLKEAQP